MKFEVGKYYLHVESGDPNTFVFKVVEIENDGRIRRKAIKYINISNEWWIIHEDTHNSAFTRNSPFAQGCRELTKEEAENIWLYEI